MSTDTILIASDEELVDLAIAANPEKALLIIMENHLLNFSSERPIAFVSGDYVYFREDLPDPVANLIGDQVLFYKETVMQAS